MQRSAYCFSGNTKETERNAFSPPGSCGWNSPFFSIDIIQKLPQNIHLYLSTLNMWCVPIRISLKRNSQFSIHRLIIFPRKALNSAIFIPDNCPVAEVKTSSQRGREGRDPLGQGLQTFSLAVEAKETSWAIGSCSLKFRIELFSSWTVWERERERSSKSVVSIDLNSSQEREKERERESERCVYIYIYAYFI